TLARIVTKSKVLVDKYHVLNAEKERLEQVVAELQNEVDALKKENERLSTDNQYLTLARNFVPNSEKTAEAKKMISSLVRDIDKCISQLNE
ncbi:MAG: hypothetical protein MJZ63_02200, partial [Muribaculaceae bacterium]|nr:hypothetical protein [Muribaculaceae bacterium]